MEDDGGAAQHSCTVRNWVIHPVGPAAGWHSSTRQRGAGPPPGCGLSLGLSCQDTRTPTPWLHPARVSLCWQLVDGGFQTSLFPLTFSSSSWGIPTHSQPRRIYSTAPGSTPASPSRWMLSLIISRRSLINSWTNCKLNSGLLIPNPDPETEERCLNLTDSSMQLGVEEPPLTTRCRTVSAIRI